MNRSGWAATGLGPRRAGRPPFFYTDGGEHMTYEDQKRLGLVVPILSQGAHIQKLLSNGIIQRIPPENGKERFAFFQSNGVECEADIDSGWFDPPYRPSTLLIAWIYTRFLFNWLSGWMFRWP